MISTWDPPEEPNGRIRGEAGRERHNFIESLLSFGIRFIAMWIMGKYCESEFQLLLLKLISSSETFKILINRFKVCITL